VHILGGTNTQEAVVLPNYLGGELLPHPSDVKTTFLFYRWGDCKSAGNHPFFLKERKGYGFLSV